MPRRQPVKIITNSINICDIIDIRDLLFIKISVPSFNGCDLYAALC